MDDHFTVVLAPYMEEAVDLDGVSDALHEDREWLLPELELESLGFVHFFFGPLLSVKCAGVIGDVAVVIRYHGVDEPDVVGFGISDEFAFGDQPQAINRS